MPLDWERHREIALRTLYKKRKEFMTFDRDRHAPNLRIEEPDESDEAWYCVVDEKSGTCDGECDEWGTALGGYGAIKTPLYLPHCRCLHFPPPQFAYDALPLSLCLFGSLSSRPHASGCRLRNGRESCPTCTSTDVEAKYPAHSYWFEATPPALPCSSARGTKR